MLLQQLFNGLIIGLIYALLALGYSLIFGVLSFINFAHGAIAMIGGYICWWLAAQLGIPVVAAAVISIVGTALIGVLMERIVYKPIRRSPRLFMIIVSLGCSYILSTSALVIWGAQAVSYPKFIPSKAYTIGNVVVNTTQMLILSVAIICMIVLTVFINKSHMGMAIRAVAIDQNTSGLMGINSDMVIAFTFGLGTALAAVSGIMMASYYGSIYPTMGTVIGNKGFAAVVLGGAGSIPGAMIGGLVLGLCESIAGTFLGSSMRELVAYIILIIVLLFKPAGLLGKDVAKE